MSDLTDLRRLDPLPIELPSLSDAEFDYLAEVGTIRLPQLTSRPGGRYEEGTSHINRHCLTCRGNGEFKFWAEGRSGDVVDYACPCLDQWTLASLFAATNISLGLGRLGRLDAELDDETYETIQPWLNDVEGHSNQGDVLVLQGKSGSGKTYLATLIMRAFLSVGYTSHLTTAEEIRSARTASFNTSGDERKEALIRFNRKIMNTDLLVVDELSSTTADATDFLASLIREVVMGRHSSLRPTILISGKDVSLTSTLRELGPLLSIFDNHGLDRVYREKRESMKREEMAQGITRPLVLR